MKPFRKVMRLLWVTSKRMPIDVDLSNGEMALVIDCGKGTTDISMRAGG